MSDKKKVGEIPELGHWVFEGYKQRMIISDWRKLLLLEQDLIFFNGHARYLVAKNLGAGVYEVSKAPLIEGE